MTDKSILFLGKKNDAHTLKALRHLKFLFNDVTACLGVWGQNLPEAATYWQGDIIVSYLSSWIVPQYLLDKARIAAISFIPPRLAIPGWGHVVLPFMKTRLPMAQPAITWIN